MTDLETVFLIAHCVTLLLLFLARVTSCVFDVLVCLCKWEHDCSFTELKHESECVQCGAKAANRNRNSPRDYAIAIRYSHSH